uniref:Sperm acrosome membrane-associated protein 1 n=1 Tax=Apteryx owenii TaxID=8824 RepID=A0A8B9QI22_APTOW
MLIERYLFFFFFAKGIVGKPISDSPASVKMPCIFISPENRFKYVWKMLIPNEPALILPNDSAIMEVCRDTHPITFQCETQEKGSVIASVKYTVYTTPELETRPPRNTRTDIVLIFSLVTGIIVIVGVIFALIFIILHRTAYKNTVVLGEFVVSPSFGRPPTPSLGGPSN